MKFFDKYKYGSYYKKLLIACYVFYLFSIMVKLTYSVEIEEVIDHFRRDRSDVALGLTIYYFVYAAAQFGLALIIHRINIKRFLIASTMLSALSFGVIGFSSDLWQVGLILGLNGVLQSFVWGGITYIVSKYFPPEILSFSSKILATGLAVANTATYGIAAVFVQFLDWRYTFVFFAVLLAISVFYMIYRAKLTENALKNGEPEIIYIPEDNRAEYVIPHDVKFNKPLLLSFLFFLALAVTVLTYGVGNWVPGLLKNVHDFPSSLSILVALITPIVTLPATLIMYNIFDEFNRIMSISAFVGFITVTLLTLMIFVYDTNLVVALVMSALLRFFIAAYATSFSAYVTMKFEYHINGGSSALLVNALASMGAGLAPYFTGLIIEGSLGWRGYYAVLTAIAVVTLIVNLVGCIVIKKRKNLAKWL